MQEVMGGTPQVIESGTILDRVDQHLKVIAGPGAGKTYWLVNHILNVLNKSARLTNASRVVCISYTNVAADQIRAGLGDAANRVEVSTIHSLLYRFVVKPYIWLIIDGEGNCPVAFNLLQGHDDPRPSQGKTVEWLKASGARQYLYKSMDQLADRLASMTWKIDGQHCKLSLPRSFVKVGDRTYGLDFTQEQLYKYKKLSWREGEIDHDDVLYFAFIILRDHPELLQLLSAKFPFVFVDEFQDTSPIQTVILKWLAESGSTVGVIGDPAQSIFGFQGAAPQDLVGFRLPGMMNLRIEGNRRSTAAIVGYLNCLRGDFSQRASRQEQGSPVTVLVGSRVNDAVEYAQKAGLLGDGSVVLARSNPEVAAIRSDTGYRDADVWIEFRKCDSERERFLHRVISGAELAVQHRYEEAFRETSRLFPVDRDLRSPLQGRFATRLEPRSVSLVLLEYLATEYKNLLGKSVYEVYTNGLSPVLASFGIRLTTLRTGACRAFMEGTNVKALVDGLVLSEEERSVRTIHKAKGAEFRTVMVSLKSEDAIEYLVKAGDGEEYRVHYVAASRARDFLLIQTPTLSSDHRAGLERLGVQVIYLDRH